MAPRVTKGYCTIFFPCTQPVTSFGLQVLCEDAHFSSRAFADKVDPAILILHVIDIPNSDRVE